MITAKNYVAQATKSLRYSALAIAEEMPRDSKEITNIVDDFSNAVHFALPDNGVIFDDALRGMRGNSARLPFQTITIEYYAEDKPSAHNKDLRIAKKRLIYCFEVPRDQVGDLPATFQKAESYIFIYAFFENEEGVWCPCSLGMAVPSTWDDTSATTLMAPDLVKARDDIKMAGFPLPFMVDLWEEMVRQVGIDKAKQYAAHDIGGEVRAVLELCEALSCSNVTHEPIEKINPAVNARRIRAGKLPLYETRCLVINAGKQTAAGLSVGGSHSSPRQHLRRGHIRRLPIGNVWVNSCVVGSAANGVIHKDYAVDIA